MPAPVRMRMEQLFGVDLSAVKIHEDDRPAAMQARAYAQSMDVHFAPGQYRPTDPAGLALLGHELTHVVQQATGRTPATTQEQGKPTHIDPTLEREADEIGAKAAEPVTPDALPVAPLAPLATTRSDVVQPFWDQVAKRTVELEDIAALDLTAVAAYIERIESGELGATLEEHAALKTRCDTLLEQILGDNAFEPLETGGATVDLGSEEPHHVWATRSDGVEHDVDDPHAVLASLLSPSAIPELAPSNPKRSMDDVERETRCTEPTSSETAAKRYKPAPRARSRGSWDDGEQSNSDDSEQSSSESELSTDSEASSDSENDVNARHRSPAPPARQTAFPTGIKKTGVLQELNPIAGHYGAVFVHELTSSSGKARDLEGIQIREKISVGRNDFKAPSEIEIRETYLSDGAMFNDVIGTSAQRIESSVQSLDRANYAAEPAVYETPQQLFWKRPDQEDWTKFVDVAITFEVYDAEDMDDDQERLKVRTTDNAVTVKQDLLGAPRKQKKIARDADSG